MKNYLIHYSKGSTSKKHKYIAIKNGKYIYPEDLQNDPNTTNEIRRKNLETMRSNASNSNKSKTDVENNEQPKKQFDIANDELNPDATEKLAYLVLGGLFGDGETRKQMLGANYAKIQAKVNEMTKTNSIDTNKQNQLMTQAHMLMQQQLKNKEK